MILNENIPEIKVMGFKSYINDVKSTLERVNALEKNLSCMIQLLDARGIAGKEHVYNAVLHALNSFKRKNNIANDLGMEICVRASAQRQISRAIEILGLKTGPMDICVVLVGCKSSSVDMNVENLFNDIFDRDDSVLEPDENILKDIYGLKNDELHILGSLPYTLIERTTLLILDA
ncbi:MAG TPA: KEOPS complex subunit Cgi121 [Methanobacteriaceae archaeon]|nr:KEOPS complex subunit Cgi121 [Methanobacteriaceae archaeon]